MAATRSRTSRIAGLIQPWQNARRRSAHRSGESLPRKPTTGIAGCCARAASGHAAIAPPRSVMTDPARMFNGSLTLDPELAAGASAGPPLRIGTGRPRRSRRGLLQVARADPSSQNRIYVLQLAKIIPTCLGCEFPKQPVRSVLRG
jgi:hypothetical protein